MANVRTRSNARNMADEVKRPVEKATRTTWMDHLTRFGYVARGILFIAIGFVALQIALGKPVSGSPDQTGALAAIAAQPNGRLLLIVVVVGLAAFSLWGFVRAIFDPLNRGAKTGGLIARIGFAISGISYGALVIPTIQLIMGTGAPKNQTQTTQDITAQLLSNPLGPAIVGLIGVLIIAWSLGQLNVTYSGKFERDLQFRRMSAQEENLARRIGQIGIAARALVFALMGAFFIQAAVQHNPSQAKGLDAALLSLEQWSGGPWLLIFAALGLISFGLYSMLCARWINVTGR